MAGERLNGARPVARLCALTSSAFWRAAQTPHKRLKLFSIGSFAVFRDRTHVRLHVRHLQRNAVYAVYGIAGVTARLLRSYPRLDSPGQGFPLHFNLMVQITVEFVANAL